MSCIVLLFLGICAATLYRSAAVKDQGPEMAVNIDGYLIKFHHRDKKRLTFNPTEDDATDNHETGNNVTADMNATDYTNLLRKLMRRSNKDDDDEDDDAKAISCVDNLARFRMMANNQPLQFVVVVEEEGEARLTCHFCEDQDKETESKEWDAAEQEQGRPVWREAGQVRSPILWYRIKHRGGEHSTSFRMSEVKPTMHDDADSNRIYVTTGHTLVLEKATPEDAGTYFCQDTRTKDRHVKAVISVTEIQEMMGSQGAFRFLIHVDVLRSMEIADKEVKENGQGYRAPAPYQPIPYNMVMFTIWARWGQCSMCDQPGEQRRRGTCWIKKNNPNSRIIESWYWDAVLSAQASGIPCCSSLFHVDKKEEYGGFRYFYRRDEIMRRACNTPCRKDHKSLFKGLMPKRTLSTSGLKSMLFNEKKDKTLVIKTINETAGVTLSLKCPGARLDEVVMWVNNSRYMPGVSLDNDTDGRVSEDINGTLHISPLLLADKGIFHCIVGGKESGHVFINVTEVMVNEFTYYGMWVLYSVGVDFLLFVILMVVKHQHRKRILISAKDAGLTGSSSDSDDDNNENANININSATTTCSLSAASSDEASSFSCVESQGESRSSSGGFTRYSSRSSCCYGLPSQTSI